ncbi:MAG: sensor histidine kinase [Anaerolineales bacterium]|nr:MAG: sensor histidine kinase [Anaerolineales bacterium]
MSQSNDRRYSKGQTDELQQQIAALSRRQAELTALYEVGKELASTLDPNQLLELILDRAITLVQAERGFLVLCDEASEGFEIAVARQFEPREGGDAEAEISRRLIQNVLTQQEPVITINAQEDPRFMGSDSIVSHHIRSVLAVPLIFQTDLIGAIYVDTRFFLRRFQDTDLALLDAMANQAAVAIHMARLYDSLQTRNEQLEAALAKLRETQDELVKAKQLSTVGKMASSIIHDIKSPLTVIKGYVIFLARDDLATEKRQQVARTVMNAIDTFTGMTQEILDYAHGESTLTLQPVNVGNFVESVCSFLETNFARKGIETQIALAFSDTLVMDAEKMRRVFYNVASNAYDAMEEGGTFTITSDLKDDHVEFHLKDTGPGIPEQIRDTLFEPFVSWGKEHGTGLGLAIARKIVEDHGGYIELVSEDGQGADFIIRLPRTNLPHPAR